ncbi:alpha/beta hydrolase family protein [Rhodococcus sp. MEB064]|uniref:alpha/beta hydrolase family protein n=1 Tax=Rhodococcus sp. MEB064 TaxID=1587522 RepID=UPI0005ABF031|nr:hypothetical protein [Rhodococcus sp. MEB064]KIQ15347.1 hypothetical protein RU01_15580 [Rhodococcus sp. MEB064]
MDVVSIGIAAADAKKKYASLALNRFDFTRLAVKGALALPAAAAQHRIDYEDAETIVEQWANVSGWSAGKGQAVDGFFVGGANSTEAGHVRLMPLTGRARISTSVVVPATVGGSHLAFLGVSGASPTPVGNAVFGIGVDPATNRPMAWRGSAIGGAGTEFLGADPLPAGKYYIDLIEDENVVSAVILNDAHTIEYRAMILRTVLGSVGSLVLYMSDTRATTGIKFGPIGIKKAMATIAPRKVGTLSAQTLTYTTSWPDLAGWTTSGGVVNAGRLYSSGTGSGLTTRPLPNLSDTSDMTIVGDIQCPAVGGSALFLVGLKGLPTSGNGSPDMVMIGMNNLNQAQKWVGTAQGGAGGTRINDTQKPAGVYPVRIRVQNGNAVFTIFETDGTTVLSTFTQSVAGLTKGFAELCVWASDTNAAAGRSLGPLSLTQVVAPSQHALEGASDTVMWTRPKVSSVSNARIAWPKNYDSRRPAPAILFCHGTGRVGGVTFDDVETRGYWQGLVDAGYIVMSADAQANAWGNPLSVTDYEDLGNYAWNHLAVSGFLVLSQSMGGMPGLNLLRKRVLPGVFGWYGTAPVCNLKAEYDLTFADQIKTAYGIAADGSDYAAKTAGHDPMLAAPEEFGGLPMRSMSYDSDAVVPPQTNVIQLLTKLAPYTPEASYTGIAGTAHIGSQAFNVADTTAFAKRWGPAPVA